MPGAMEPLSSRPVGQDGQFHSAMQPTIPRGSTRFRRPCAAPRRRGFGRRRRCGAMSRSKTCSMDSRKPPKCGATKKSARHRGHPADVALGEKRTQRTDVRVVAAVLHDRERPPAVFGGGDHRSCRGERVGHRLLTEHVTPGLERCERQASMGLGHRAVEHHGRSNVGEHGAEVAADRRTAAEASCRVVRPVGVGVEVDEADELGVGCVAQRVEPQAADAAAADLEHSESFVHVVHDGASLRANHAPS